MKDEPHSKSLFDDCVDDIERAYDELGYDLGWRFLSVSKEVLDTPVNIALVTLNPAGDEIPLDHPWASCEEGVSFVVERWGDAPPGNSKLQIQVRKMFESLASTLGVDETGDELMSRSLISHFIPFRSPRLDQLPNQKAAMEFGRSMWAKILPVAKPQLIICLGRDVQTQIKDLIQSELSGQLIESNSFATGWGDYNADLDVFETPNGIVRLLYLPHLSTWTLFTSEKTFGNMPAIIEAATKGIRPDAPLPIADPAREVSTRAPLPNEKEIGMPILEVKTELIGTKLHRLKIFHNNKFIGEYEKSQLKDIERKSKEVSMAAGLLLQIQQEHGEFVVRWDGNERKKSIRVEGIEVSTIPRSMWQAPSWK